VKQTLTADLVSQMTLLKFPELGVSSRDRKPAPGANYLVYGAHRDAPVRFGIRVGKNASVFLVEKKVAGKNMKIPMGLARGRKGAEKPSFGHGAAQGV